MKYISIITLCCGLWIATVLVAAQAPRYTWQKTDTSVTLLNNGKMVWQHVHDKTIGKPYMRVGLLDGTELTRPWPFPKDYPKADHLWHRALWWSWKGIDGINFWEKHQEGTEPDKVKTTLNDDGSARIEMDISYHLPDQQPLACEKRVIDISAPDQSGSYLITWRATFTAGNDKPVVFNKNGYGGFALRMAAQFSGDPTKDPNAWQFIQSTEPTDAPRKGHRWAAYTGKAQNGKPATLAMFDHPDNPRYPTQWALRTNYPYMNPAFTADKEDYTLKPGESLKLTYGVLVKSGAGKSDELEQAWKEFVKSAREKYGRGDTGNRHRHAFFR